MNEAAVILNAEPDEFSAIVQDEFGQSIVEIKSRIERAKNAAVKAISDHIDCIHEAVKAVESDGDIVLAGLASGLIVYGVTGAAKNMCIPATMAYHFADSVDRQVSAKVLEIAAQL